VLFINARGSSLPAAQSFAEKLSFHLARNSVHPTFVPSPASFDTFHCISAILKGADGGGSLDSLSVRCLSSYLFFPPDPGAQQAVAGVDGAAQD